MFLTHDAYDNGHEQLMSTFNLIMITLKYWQAQLTHIDTHSAKSHPYDH
jgi:hypothetical protein